MARYLVFACSRRDVDMAAHDEEKAPGATEHADAQETAVVEPGAPETEDAPESDETEDEGELAPETEAEEADEEGDEDEGESEADEDDGEDDPADEAIAEDA